MSTLKLSRKMVPCHLQQPAAVMLIARERKKTTEIFASWLLFFKTAKESIKNTLAIEVMMIAHINIKKEPINN